MYQSVKKILNSGLPDHLKEIELEKYLLRIDEEWVDAFKFNINNNDFPSDTNITNVLLNNMYKDYVKDFTLRINEYKKKMV